MDHPFSFIFHGHGLYYFFWHALWACGIPFLGMHLLFLTCLLGHVAYLLWACIFSFLTCLLGMWHTFFGYASFHFFIAHTIYNMERVIMDQARNFYCMDEWWMMLIPSVGISHMKWTCTWSWSQSMKRLLLGSHNLTKLNKATSSIWIRFIIEELALHHFFCCANLKLSISSIS